MPGNERILSIFFVDSETGWIAGDGDIFKTTDGGENWEIQLEKDYWSLYSVFFTSKDTGWVVGDGSEGEGYYGYKSIILNVLFYPFYKPRDRLDCW